MSDLLQSAVYPRSAVSKRYKLRFDTEAQMDAALATEAPIDIAATSRRRRIMSVDVPAAVGPELAAPFTNIATEFGARIVEDFQYDLEELDFFNPNAFSPDDPSQASLDDVIMQIGADQAWGQSRGANVVIAVVDTGIDGTRPEFPLDKRFERSWAAEGEQAWTDWQGHGTMCATIAAGTTREGGVFNGVAPDASIMACRTHLYDTELAAIYDELADLAREGYTVVATNSYGLRRGTPPPPPEDSDFPDALQDAINAGVIVFFSAGNYHHLAGGTPAGHTPNSIWLHKGRADLMTVGAAKPNQEMWYYSSRGPGQFFGTPNTREKPDVVGITPPKGRIVYGGQVLVLDDGWGTSGCCPQVAGLAALMLAKRQQQGGAPLDRDSLFDIIRNTSTPLPHHAYCCGAGSINCLAALNAV